ncbi:hypothetical protein [Falsiroseomonas tokyonensis]|uniref:Uncharacterized protein n=1 Tax=Falsiroseomonas tokyonensis TaxID=430521 RepID=A0ABV7BPH6_9PROT|nr:hypothetical protein [Falsiroseomonas tokyonensis]MBU8536474.1 hypothetical protein [Falsiroseomonas tokyonensis]
MRLILLALLSVLVLAPQSADAARRDERSGTSVSRTNLAASPASRASTRATPRAASRATPATASRSTPRSASRATPRSAARTAARSSTRSAARSTPRTAARATARASSRSAARSSTRQAAASRQQVVRRGDVRTQRGGVVVRGAAAATISRRSSIAGWQAGLPAVTMSQRDCPVGTFATLARGHDDIVRCMPL